MIKVHKGYQICFSIVANIQQINHTKKGSKYKSNSNLNEKTENRKRIKQIKIKPGCSPIPLYLSDACAAHNSPVTSPVLFLSVTDKWGQERTAG